MDLHDPIMTRGRFLANQTAFNPSPKNWSHRAQESRAIMSQGRAAYADRHEFMATVDALVIGRKTFETVLTFEETVPSVT
jgi:hypothetical protein